MRHRPLTRLLGKLSTPLRSIKNPAEVAHEAVTAANNVAETVELIDMGEEHQRSLFRATRGGFRLEPPLAVLPIEGSTLKAMWPI